MEGNDQQVEGRWIIAEKEKGQQLDDFGKRAARSLLFVRRKEEGPVRSDLEVIAESFSIVGV
jgi:hypothetical protein